MRLKSNPVLWIDAGGAVLTAGLLGVTAWMALSGGAAGDVSSLRGSIAASDRQVSALRAELANQRDAIEAKRQELRDKGHIPEGEPIERDLQKLAELARLNRISVVRVAPLAPRAYPGLLEVRYAFDATGTIPDLTRFFKAVEDSPFWADISHLKIESDRSGGKDDAAARGQRSAQLTISLFSAPKPGTDGEPSGT